MTGSLQEAATEPTASLSKWVEHLDATTIPPDVLERAKYLILDGIACGLVGAHVPWSEQLANAVRQYEPRGKCRVIGYEDHYGPLAAALLNGAFIQATELDDYHSGAPLHSASVILPALLAATDAAVAPDPISGLSLLVAAIAGFETGPRIGHALYGSDLLSRGWHSGPVFGSPAAATATSKLLGLNAKQIESAIGIAATQAGGLMSAQYEGMIKRVQHAFAARNGLFGALLARTDYLGIEKVLERPYGGYLAMFSAGNARDPPYLLSEITKQLGDLWHTQRIRIKLYACVGGCHGQIEALEQLQQSYPQRFAATALGQIRRITVWLSAPIHAHDGWFPEQRPLTTTGAQMNAAYIGAVQLIDRQVLLSEFAEQSLNRAEIWDIVDKTECLHSSDFDLPDRICGARVRVQFQDGYAVEKTVYQPKGFDPPTTNEEIYQKWRRLVSSVLTIEQREAIEHTILKLEELQDVRILTAMLSICVRNPLG
ncbi:2-methylcitrate dehydratase PrpD [Xylona heveae TC161]|uniref:2-methylcitrate dehydratase PrpD n=1 Tax=Xylona heveae (strain CBS 132557 / TC161) TaxID=1328760 RepID=A0A165FGY7_XYLHT|nr:2-methylcitrate dehydratase PrpD [Xylona heveae TC161]KZF20967.1 2-methylcitrate dehydratase PrpD [Xylona heveae TC161]